MLADFFAGLACSYIGMLALCQGLERHYKQLWKQLPSVRLSRLLRLCGWVCLGLSLYFCAQAWGWAMGPVGWFGMLSLSGFGLLMLLPYRPLLAVRLPLGFAPVWAVITTLT